jgi:geranylgeranyl pyrophosphate synthase
MATPQSSHPTDIPGDFTLSADSDADRSSFLQSVEQRLASLVEPHHDGEADILERAASHLTLAPMAKRARPRLVYQFGRCFDVDTQDLVHMACAAELVHTASLLHDDVIDEGTERRGRTTANRKWRNLVAVLTGDLALCLSLQELHDLPRVLTTRAIDVVETMTRAIMLESDARRNPAVTTEQWRTIAVGKTGELFGWCAAAPALAAGHHEWGDRLFTAGRHLGAAFQRADDLRDLLSDREGKDRYADIKNGAPSAILAAATDRDPELADTLRAYWHDERDLETGAIAELVIDSGALDDADAALRKDVDDAIQAIGSLREHPAARDVSDWAAKMCLGALDLIPDAR